MDVNQVRRIVKEMGQARQNDQAKRHQLTTQELEQYAAGYWGDEMHRVMANELLRIRDHVDAEIQRRYGDMAAEWDRLESFNKVIHGAKI